MRLDLFLKKVFIIKQRETAKQLCDGGYVKVNGIAAKPARDVRVSDLIVVETAQGMESYRVLMVPNGNVRKDEVGQYCELVNKVAGHE
jgi:ribosomal 50S subunit-recycling heat shock protein